MANNVTLTTAMRSTLNSLQMTSDLLTKVQDRISTGKRVNSAIDDPVAYFQALGLDNRAADLTARKDNIGMGVSTIKAATDALTSMSKLIDQAKSLASQAKEASTQVTKITSGLDLTANSADVTGSALNNTDTFTVSVNGKTAQTVTISTGDSVTDLANAITQLDSALTATYNSTTGKIEITAAAGTTVTFADGVGTPLADSSLFTVGTTTFGSTGSGSSIASLESNYKGLMDQIDALKNDASFKGINLLNGNNLTVAFNEDASSSLTVSGVTYNHTGLGFTAKASVDWTTAGNIDTAITEADAALSTVRSQISTFGTNLGVVNTRLDFTNNLINTLKEGSGKLVNSNSQEDAAEVLALQTRQALGVQALTMLNQSQQSVLSLFR